MSKKLTYGFVKESFEKEGYVFITKKYKNAFQKLDYVCRNGHTHSIKWNDWQQGQRCPYCAGQGKPTIEFIRFKFEKEGYVLLDDVYINSTQKLSYTCPQGHKHSISWDNWQQGRRCLYCNIGKKGNNIKFTIEFIRSEFEKEGYILLTDVYVNCSQKLKYICPKRHQHSIIWSSWQRGSRCPTCKYIKQSGSGNTSWKGGISCEPYCDVWLDKDFKESIRERDNYICQNPDCWRKDCKDGALSIHHVDYNKKSCEPKNLITVCRSCNARANKDRKWHKSWYQAILNKRYGYKYKSSKIVGG